MIARELPLFSATLTALEAPLMARDLVHERHVAREAEMSRLADRVLTAFTNSQLVTVVCSAIDGYTLKASPEAAQDLARAALALAVASGNPVTTNIDGQVQDYSAPPMSVLLPGTYPNFSVRDEIVRGLAKTLIQGVYSSDSSWGENHTLNSRVQKSSEEILKLTDKISAFAEIRQTSFGGREIVFGNDLTILARPEFSRLLEELRISTDIARVVIQPSTHGIDAHVHQALGSSFPWMMSRKPDGSGYIVETDQSFRTAEGAILALVNQFSAQIAAPVALTIRSLLPGSWVRAPVSASVGEAPALNIDGPDYLFARLSQGSVNSNIATLQLPYRIATPAMREFVNQHLNPGSCYVNVTDGARGLPLAPDRYIGTMRNLARKLGETGISVSGGVDGVTVRIPTSVDVRDYSKLVLFVDFVEATRELCASRVLVQRLDNFGEIYDYLSRTLGNDDSWSFTQTARDIHLLSRNPKNLPEKLGEAVRSLFGRELVVTRNPEPMQGRELAAPLREPGRITWGQLQGVVDQIASILPPGLGEQVVTKVEGNRLIIYSKTRNLPDSYLNSLTRDLYGLPVPIVVREDFEATKADRPRILRDIINRTLPEDVFLRQMSRTSDGIKVVLSSRNAGDEISPDLLEQIGNCAAVPITFVKKPIEANLESLLSRASDTASRRVLARAVGLDNQLVNQKVFRSLMLEHFDYFRIAPLTMRAEHRSSLGTITDLTHLNCFSVDRDNTRVHEDAFSVTPRADGGFSVGIHIINAAHEISYGSAAEVHARARGRSSYVEMDGSTVRFHAIPVELRAPLNMSVGRACKAFSYLFDIDADYRLLDGSQQLVLSEIRNNRHLNWSDIDRGEHAESGLAVLNKFALKNRSLFDASVDGQAHVRAQELVRGLMQMFNDQAGQVLLDAGVAIPATRQTRHHFDIYKFTGPARDFERLISQRQLDSYLSGSPTLSSGVIGQHIAETGMPASQSFAYSVFKRAEEVRGSSPDAPIRITRSGGLMTGGIPPRDPSDGSSTS